MDPTLHRLMQQATRLTKAGQLSDATALIQRALRGEGDAIPADDKVDVIDVIDGCVVDANPAVHGARLVADADMGASAAASASAAAGSGTEQFTEASFTHGSRSLDYKLYVPPGAGAGPSLPLVVMLHGCTQHPDDFAAGTGMNACARSQGFYVLYPAQSKQANPQGCWNWFKHTHQERGRGEPAAIAALTQQVMQRHAVDPRRVYVAGLSAGGAMAAIVAEAYPEVFAAVGVHSGLPTGAAGNLGEALSAMQGSASPMRARRRPGASSARPVPAIVFHGDQDHTVHQRNGEQLIAAVIAGEATGADGAQAARPAARVEQGVSARGRRYTRSVHVDAQDAPFAEHWLVHGAGHAWSGGLAAGSYTDAQGPDASAEMLRFFFEHPHAHPRPL